MARVFLQNMMVGSASKEQVQFMVKNLLTLKEAPRPYAQRMLWRWLFATLIGSG